jgi:hypothetical protein
LTQLLAVSTTEVVVHAVAGAVNDGRENQLHLRMGVW